MRLSMDVRWMARITVDIFMSPKSPFYKSAALFETAGVSNVTSVKRALVALEKAGLIYLSLGEWKFISPFFREWIRRR